MKMIRTFDITSDEFYNELEQSLIKDVTDSTGRKMNVGDIKKGFNYTKFAQREQAKVLVTINDYVRGSIYSCTMKAKTDYITITYITKETDKGLQIEFDQYISDWENTKHKKNFLLKGWSEMVYFGRMSETLYGIRETIQKRREGIVDKPVQRPESFKLLRKHMQKKVAEMDAKEKE